METHIPTILLTLGLLSVANCYLRGDYNPALFMFSYFLWNLKPHLRQTLVYVIFYSWFIDLVWTLTYLLLWRSDSFQIYRTNFNNTTLLVSAILFTLKFILIIFMVVVSRNCRKWLSPSTIFNELRAFFGSSP